MSNLKLSGNPYLDQLNAGQVKPGSKKLEYKWCCAQHRRKARETEKSFETKGLDMSKFSVVHETCGAEE